MNRRRSLSQGALPARRPRDASDDVADVGDVVHEYAVAEERAQTLKKLKFGHHMLRKDYGYGGKQRRSASGGSMRNLSRPRTAADGPQSDNPQGRQPLRGLDRDLMVGISTGQATGAGPPTASTSNGAGMRTCSSSVRPGPVTDQCKEEYAALGLGRAEIAHLLQHMGTSQWDLLVRRELRSIRDSDSDRWLQFIRYLINRLSKKPAPSRLLIPPEIDDPAADQPTAQLIYRFAFEEDELSRLLDHYLAHPELDLLGMLSSMGIDIETRVDALVLLYELLKVKALFPDFEQWYAAWDFLGQYNSVQTVGSSRAAWIQPISCGFSTVISEATDGFSLSALLPSISLMERNLELVRADDGTPLSSSRRQLLLKLINSQPSVSHNVLSYLVHAERIPGELPYGSVATIPDLLKWYFGMTPDEYSVFERDWTTLPEHVPQSLVDEAFDVLVATFATLPPVLRLLWDLYLNYSRISWAPSLQTIDEGVRPGSILEPLDLLSPEKRQQMADGASLIIDEQDADILHSSRGSCIAKDVPLPTLLKSSVPLFVLDSVASEELEIHYGCRTSYIHAAIMRECRNMLGNDGRELRSELSNWETDVFANCAEPAADYVPSYPRVTAEQMRDFDRFRTTEAESDSDPSLFAEIFNRMLVGVFLPKFKSLVALKLREESEDGVLDSYEASLESIFKEPCLTGDDHSLSRPFPTHSRFIVTYNIPPVLGEAMLKISEFTLHNNALPTARFSAHAKGLMSLDAIYHNARDEGGRECRKFTLPTPDAENGWNERFRPLKTYIASRDLHVPGRVGMVARDANSLSVGIRVAELIDCGKGRKKGSVRQFAPFPIRKELAAAARRAIDYYGMPEANGPNSIAWSSVMAWAYMKPLLFRLLAGSCDDDLNPTCSALRDLDLHPLQSLLITERKEYLVQLHLRLLAGRQVNRQGLDTSKLMTHRQVFRGLLYGLPGVGAFLFNRVLLPSMERLRLARGELMTKESLLQLFRCYMDEAGKRLISRVLTGPRSLASPFASSPLTPVEENVLVAKLAEFVPEGRREILNIFKSDQDLDTVSSLLALSAADNADLASAFPPDVLGTEEPLALLVKWVSRRSLSKRTTLSSTRSGYSFQECHREDRQGNDMGKGLCKHFVDPANDYGLFRHIASVNHPWTRIEKWYKQSSCGWDRIHKIFSKSTGYTFQDQRIHSRYETNDCQTYAVCRIGTLQQQLCLAIVDSVARHPARKQPQKSLFGVFRTGLITMCTRDFIYYVDALGRTPTGLRASLPEYRELEPEGLPRIEYYRENLRPPNLPFQVYRASNVERTRLPLDPPDPALGCSLVDDVAGTPRFISYDAFTPGNDVLLDIVSTLGNSPLHYEERVGLNLQRDAWIRHFPMRFRPLQHNEPDPAQ